MLLASLLVPTKNATRCSASRMRNGLIRHGLEGLASKSLSHEALHDSANDIAAAYRSDEHPGVHDGHFLQTLC